MISFISHLVTISSVSITLTNPSSIAGESTVTLTCTVTLSGPGTPTINWSGPMSRGPVSPEQLQASFTDTLQLVRVRQTYAGVYTCRASIGAITLTDSVSLSVTG